MALEKESQQMATRGLGLPLLRVVDLHTGDSLFDAGHGSAVDVDGPEDDRWSTWKS